MCAGLNIHLLFIKVWPDYPNITVNESLDWDTQVEVQYFT